MKTKFSVRVMNINFNKGSKEPSELFYNSIKRKKDNFEPNAPDFQDNEIPLPKYDDIS